MGTLPPEILKKIRKIHIQSAQLAQDLLAGAYRSAFKGQGMEFEEDREYQPGDEIRTIDWNVTARMNHLYVKNFREERDLTVMLLVDISGSTHCGSHFGLKNELIAEIGAVLAFSAINNNDKVGLILFSDIVEKYIPPRKGTRHVLRVIRELLMFQPTQTGSDLKAALGLLGKVHKRGSICFVLSDFLYALPQHDLNLAARQHDLIGIAILDVYEKQFPSIGLTWLRDIETGKERLVDTSSPAIKKGFSEMATQNAKTLKQIMSRAHADLIQISTDYPYLTELRRFFRYRQIKRR